MKPAIVLLCAALALPASAQLQQGVTLFEQGRYDEAKGILAPLRSDPEAVKTLGLIALAEGDDDRAIELFEKAVQMHPNSAAYHFRLGRALGAKALKASIFARMSLARRMKEQFEKVVALDPNHLDARLGLIDFYVMAPATMGGGEEKAMHQAAEIRKRDASMGQRAYARIYTLQKKNDLVRKEWQHFVREQPMSPLAHSLYGWFLGNTDQKVKEGFDEIELAVNLDPSYMPAWYRLGNLAANSGARLARGEEALKKYLTYKPAENEPSLANAHYFLGVIYEKQGKAAEAKQSYSEASRFAPSSKTFAEALQRVSSRR
jgi:Tfp pilus assembly protein PilF